MSDPGTSEQPPYKITEKNFMTPEAQVIFIQKKFYQAEHSTTSSNQAEKSNLEQALNNFDQAIRFANGAPCRVDSAKIGIDLANTQINFRINRSSQDPDSAAAAEHDKRIIAELKHKAEDNKDPLPKDYTTQGKKATQVVI